MTFEEFKAYVEGYYLALDWRRGQTAFNLLYQARPDMANNVRATDVDPFHRDERLPEFWSYVAEHWAEH